MRTVAETLLLAVSATIATASVSQVHLSLAGDGAANNRVVEWVSSQYPGNTVAYGPAGGPLSKTATGYCVEYSTIGHLCHAELADLEQDARIVYEIEKSFTANFSTGTVGNRPPVVSIFADMGYENAMSVPKLIEEAQKSSYDAIIHAGDVSCSWCCFYCYSCLDVLMLQELYMYRHYWHVWYVRDRGKLMGLQYDIKGSAAPAAP